MVMGGSPGVMGGPPGIMGGSPVVMGGTPGVMVIIMRPHGPRSGGWGWGWAPPRRRGWGWLLLLRLTMRGVVTPPHPRGAPMLTRIMVVLPRGCTPRGWQVHLLHGQLPGRQLSRSFRQLPWPRLGVLQHNGSTPRCRQYNLRHRRAWLRYNRHRPAGTGRQLQYDRWHPTRRGSCPDD